MAQREPGSDRQALWRQRLRRQAGSGQSVRAFCAAEGVSEPAFYAWRRRMRHSEGLAGPSAPVAARGRLVEVQVAEPDAAEVAAGASNESGGDAMVQLHLLGPDGVRVTAQVSISAAAAVLRELLAGDGRRSC